MAEEKKEYITEYEFEIGEEDLPELAKYIVAQEKGEECEMKQFHDFKTKKKTYPKGEKEPTKPVEKPEGIPTPPSFPEAKARIVKGKKGV